MNYFSDGNVPLYGKIVDWSNTPMEDIAYVKSEAGLRWVMANLLPPFHSYEPFNKENKIVDMPTKCLQPLPLW